MGFYGMNEHKLNHNLILHVFQMVFKYLQKEIC